MTSIVSFGHPRFITLDEALVWHELAIIQHGGSFGLRDQGTLESALAQPKQAFSGQPTHSFPFEMAAAYAFHIAKNHPFVDGNKRVALACCAAFLRLNGWNLTSEGEAAADAVVDLVTDKLDKTEFTAWLCQNTKARASVELRDFFAMLSLDQVRTMAQSVVASRSEDEAKATTNEAGGAIPLIVELESKANEIRNLPEGHEERDLTQAQGLDYASVVLTSLYRIAEDMGYEW